MNSKVISIVVCLIIFTGGIQADDKDDESKASGKKLLNGPMMDGFGGGGCPLCDSSVYSYCSDKLFHDACCCNPGPPLGNGLGASVQCQYTDCSYLHANSCYEHNLIVTCCCYSPY